MNILQPKQQKFLDEARNRVDAIITHRQEKSDKPQTDSKLPVELATMLFEIGKVRKALVTRRDDAETFLDESHETLSNINDVIMDIDTELKCACNVNC